jgi:hypothetical protein
LQPYHLNLCFKWQIFQRSFRTPRDMLTPMPCIGRVCHISCGRHFSCLATLSHRNMMEWSIVKRVSSMQSEDDYSQASITIPVAAHRDWCGWSPSSRHIFCDQHPDEVARYPIGLFPATDSRDPEWTFWVSHFGHLLGDLTEETLHATVRFMNAQYHH